MKLVKQSHEILEQEIPVRKLDDNDLSYKNRYLETMYKHIEKCGRTCYKSEDKITETSAEKFVNGLIKSGHLSVLEHGVIYLTIQHHTSDKPLNKLISKYLIDPHSKVSSKIVKPDYVPLEKQKIGEPMSGIVNNYITTNYRVIIENGWEEDLQYLCEPTQYHEKRHTALLHTCIHVYKDVTRHRNMSFSIESTRYCNYSKTEKFGEMKFVLPPWIKEEPTIDWSGPKKLHQPLRKEGEPLNDFGRVWYELCMEDIDKDWITNEYTLVSKWNAADIYCHGLKCEEDSYNLLIESGWQPQQAAELLPQATAADVVMSGFESDWTHVFNLRSDIAATGKPHPLVEEIMTPLRDEMYANFTR